MRAYLEPSDTGAFTDWPTPRPVPADHKTCPKCTGHGGWNLVLNAYSLHGRPDTPENRHLYSHFRTICGTCNGWGYVHQDMNCPDHKWVYERKLGRCYHLYRCESCGRTSEVDSGD